MAILIGLISILLGIITLGIRYMHKFRNKFMAVNISNGFIGNTCCSLVLFLSSYLGFTISDTYILESCMYMLCKIDKNKSFDLFVVAKNIIFALAIILISASITVAVSFFLLYLDYNGPHLNDKFVYIQP